MLVDRLPFVVVFRVRLAISARKCLRGLISFEAHIQLLLMLCLVGLTQALIAEHEIVVSLQVFRIDAEYPLQGRDGIRVLPFQKEDSAQIILRDAVTRVL